MRNLEPVPIEREFCNDWLKCGKQKRHNNRKRLSCLKTVRYNSCANKKHNDTAMDLAQQLSFRPDLPVILNNVDYLRQEEELKRIDQILRLSGIEEDFAQAWLFNWLGDREESQVSGEAMGKQLERARRGLRCVILQSLLALAYRKMSVRLAECALFRWFCALDRMDEIKVPSKSEVHRFTQMVDAQTLKELNQSVIALAARPATEAGQLALGLKNEIELKTIWMDSTALKANIHYPTDWVLLRDATRTLMKATLLIRDHGLKRRMIDPSRFMTRMNRLCMEMSALRRKADSKRGRKRVLRKMKKMMKTVRDHAQRHPDLLETRWSETDWSQKQAAQVIGRIEGVLLQLPEAIELAHARIIRGQRTENSRKILSLYESEVNVIVRGKPEAEIEFGNSLLLAEQKDGLIVDWELHKKSAPNDSRQLQECVGRIEEANGAGAVSGDRQFDSALNRRWLENRGIYNGLCPRSAKELANKSKSSKFQKLQRRRAQTEARIAILKNVFLNNPVNRKGFKSREQQKGWSVLSHNLWLLARLEQAEEEPGELPLAA